MLVCCFLPFAFQRVLSPNIIRLEATVAGLEEEEPSDLLWVLDLDLDRKKRIRGKTYYDYKRIETREEFEAMLRADYEAWVQYMKDAGAWHGVIEWLRRSHSFWSTDCHERGESGFIPPGRQNGAGMSRQPNPRNHPYTLPSDLMG